MSGLATATGGLRCFARVRSLALVFVLLGVAVCAQTRAGADELAHDLMESRAIASTPAPAASFADQPFGYAPVTLTEGRLVEKWRDLSARVETDMAEMMICRADPLACTSTAAMQLISMVESARERDGLARIGEINRSVNLGLRFQSDFAQHGEVDVWSSPLESLTSGVGDCEDFAILKLAALRAVGIAEEDLRLVILRHNAYRDDHAVAAVRIDGAWRVLDNQRFLMLEDWQVNGYRAAFVMDVAGVHSYADPNIALNGVAAETGVTQQPLATTPAQRNADAQIAGDAHNS